MGCFMGQYSRLDGLLENLEDAIAILCDGLQEIERVSPSQDILVRRPIGRHLKLAFRVFLK